MRMKQKDILQWDTMSLTERGDYIRQTEECVREHGNKELLLLFRLMLETGIRLGDVLELKEENVKGRTLQVVESKFGGKDYYHNPDGSLPVISEETAELLVPDEEGKFFHHDKRYYNMLIRKIIPNKPFSFHYLRQYVMDVRRLTQ